MSFIHLSTVQPTDGQEEVTARQPALVKNDFRNGILIQKGETLELVGLRLAFTNIEITKGVNDLFFYQVGDAPNFCQLKCTIPPGVYNETQLGTAVQRAMELAMNLPSYNDIETPTGDFGNNGVSVTYVAATATDPAKYVITLNQMENNEVGDHTLNEMGAAQGADVTDVTFCPRSGIDDESLIGNINGGYLAQSGPGNPENDASLLSHSTITSQAHGMTGTTEIFPPNFSDVLASNFGRDNNENMLATQCIIQSGAPVEGATDQIFDEEIQTVEEPELIESVIDVGGRVCAGIAPAQGFLLTSLTTAISGVSMTLFIDEIGSDVTGTVTIENGDATSNYWNFRYDITQNGPIDALDGSGRTGITRLYGAFSENLETYGYGVIEAGGLYWGVGTGADGTAGPPDDARDANNHNWRQELQGGEGVDFSRWYYDFRGCDGDVDFKCQLLQVEGGSRHWRINWETEGCSYSGSSEDPTDIATPAFFRADGQDIVIPPDKTIGWQPTREGVNRRVREVKDGMMELNTSDPFKPSRGGIGGINAGGEHELQDYWIGIKAVKDDQSFKVDQNGFLVPVVEVCIPQPFEGAPLYPNPGNLASAIIIEEFLDETALGALNPAQDLWLQVQVDNMNQLSFGVAQKAQQDPRKANLVAPIAPGKGDFTALTQTGTGQNDVPTQIKQSDYPLIGSLLVSRGGYYPPKNSVDQQSLDNLGSYIMVDCAVAQREANIVLDGDGRKALTAEPDLFKKKSFTTAPDLSGNRYNLKNMYKFGKVRFSSETFRTTATQQNPANPEYYENREDNKVLGEFIFQNNNADADRILGMPALINKTTATTADGQNTTESSNQVRTHPLTDVFHVEILSEPVSSANGATGDKGKSIYTLSAEEVEVDSLNRIITYTPKTRLPVDLNVAQDKTIYSLTAAIKDVNNRLVGGLRAPTDITLFKSLPEGTKIQRAVHELKEVLQGKQNDKNANEIDNIGIHNPILGVIPK